MIANLSRLGRRLASLWVTLACLGAAAIIALLGENGRIPVGLYISVPFAILFVNLVAAVATSPSLRNRGGLLGFHISLAVLALLIACDRLTALYGHVEVTEGAPFDPRYVEATAGPLHPWALDRVRFAQGAFQIRYAPGMRRRDTISTVFVPDRAGWRPVDVGDDKPLVMGDYRFYTSFNKGFAPTLTFVDSGGLAHTGTVHLPSYPLNYFKQGNEWTLPGTSKTVKLWLHLPNPVYAEDAVWRFRRPENASLVVIDGTARHELHPGQMLAVPEGDIRFDGVRTWMGYTISYNPLAPWMLAAAAVGLGFLMWHIGAKFRTTPWDRDREDARAANA